MKKIGADSVKNKESKQFLNDYITKLLSDKEKLKKSDLENARQHIYNVACKFFDLADKEDKEGNGCKKTASNFYIAHTLLEVLKIFGEWDSDTTQLARYAQWKAVDISTSLKKGETPMIGAPLLEYGTEMKIPPFKITSVGDKTERPTQQPQPPHYKQPQPHQYQQPQPPQYKPQPQPQQKSNLSKEEFVQAQKFAKHAISALEYEEVACAIENLQKAIDILQKQ